MTIKILTLLDLPSYSYTVGLNDKSYNEDCSDASDNHFYINNHEPLFDAADFMRFGKEKHAIIFVQQITIPCLE